MPPLRIYLTGFMGSGKSTVGPRLATALGYSFIDLDEAIEHRAGRPIRQLFAEEGEAAFRQLERELLRETTVREHLVVALGGGALTFEENLRLALGAGRVVYLRASADVLARRLRSGRAVRPLLLGDDGRPLSDADLRARIEAMLERRAPFYERAHLAVDAGRAPDVTVRAIVDALARVDA